jgi:hypothetical protein
MGCVRHVFAPLPVVLLAATAAVVASSCHADEVKDVPEKKAPEKVEPEKVEPEKAVLPAADDFTRAVLEVVKTYPTDGTHRYHWPKTGGWPGTTRDVFYEGKKVCEADPEGRCFCCGLTFEVFVRAYEKLCAEAKKPFKILDLDAKGVIELRREWFGPTAKDRTTLLKAVERFQLGKKVPLAEARAGDFCQLWRRSGSGHSVVLMAIEKDDKGKPTALRYWSTQKSTNGIHENTEKFSETEKSGVLVDETYVARIGR